MLTWKCICSTIILICIFANGEMWSRSESKCSIDSGERTLVCPKTSDSDIFHYLDTWLGFAGFKCVACERTNAEILLEKRPASRWQQLYWINENFHGTFFNFPNLNTIGLQNNNLTLQTITFEKNPLLKKIFIQWNRMQSLPGGLFKNNPELEYIKLSDNYLETIPDDLLQSCPKLEYIDLSNNRISYLPEDFFKNNSKLVMIYLQNNRLTTIPTVGHLIAPKRLFIQNNPVLQINYHEIFKLTTLEWLDFNNLPCYTLKDILDYCFYKGYCTLEWHPELQTHRLLMLTLNVNDPNPRKMKLAIYYYREGWPLNYVVPDEEWAGGHHHGIKCLDYCGDKIVHRSTGLDRSYIDHLIRTLQSVYEATESKETFAVPAMAALEKLEQLKNLVESVECPAQ